MKLLYATSIIYPSPYANRKQTISMAKSFAKLLKQNFVLGMLDCKAEISGVSKVFVSKTNKSFILGFKYNLLIKKGKFSDVLCREEKLLFFIWLYNQIFFRNNVNFYYEAHFVPSKIVYWYKRMINNCKGIICITDNLRKEITKHLNEKVNLLVASDGVNLDEYKNLLPKKEARSMFNIDQNKKIVMYCGSVFKHEWKGVDILLDSINFLPENCKVIVVGARPEEKKEILKNYDSEKVGVLEILEDKLVPHVLSASDVLVLPNKSGFKISEAYTSPLKLFEYMASGRPIVCSRLPSLSEILDDKMAYFVKPNDPMSLSRGIQRALSEDTSAQEKMLQKIAIEVQKYSWDNRAQKVISFM